MISTNIAHLFWLWVNTHDKRYSIPNISSMIWFVGFGENRLFQFVNQVFFFMIYLYSAYSSLFDQLSFSLICDFSQSSGFFTTLVVGGRVVNCPDVHIFFSFIVFFSFKVQAAYYHSEIRQPLNIINKKKYKSLC